MTKVEKLQAEFNKRLKRRQKGVKKSLYRKLAGLLFRKID